MTADPRPPYDPTVLDISGSRADVAWLRASGITNVPERLTALLDAYEELQRKVERVEALHREHFCEACATGYGPCKTRAALASQPQQEQS